MANGFINILLFSFATLDKKGFTYVDKHEGVGVSEVICDLVGAPLLLLPRILPVVQLLTNQANIY
jgi:hypothetical protein